MEPQVQSTGGTSAFFRPHADRDVSPTCPRQDIRRKRVRRPEVRRLEDAVAWENSELLGGDLTEEVAKLKESSGGIITVLGSGQLVQTLIEHDLIDEYFLAVFPIVLGSGKRLFRDGDQPMRLNLIDSKPTSTGGVILTYRPASEPARPRR